LLKRSIALIRAFVEARHLLGGRRFYYPVRRILFFLFFLTAGCAMVETKPVGVTVVVTEPVALDENASSADFELTGRISVQDEEQRFSGGVRWQHASKAGDEISLLSPLGQIMVQIVQDNEGARLTTSEQKVFFASDIEILTETVLGWRIPVAGLQYWVQGEHFPATAAIKHLDSEGRVVAINQDDWEIDYVRYFPAHSVHAARPKVLVLKYATLRMKLVVDDWGDSRSPVAEYSDYQNYSVPSL
jgi:outer membrane lipoprotein LolB